MGKEKKEKKEKTPSKNKENDDDEGGEHMAPSDFSDGQDDP